FSRRLWGEEIHDTIVMATGVKPAPYVIAGVLYPLPAVEWAMDLPDTLQAAGISNLFLRGNRDTNARLGGATVLQGLNMMNNTFVTNRVRNSQAGSLVNLLLARRDLNDDQVVEEMFLATLSRYPTASERAAGRAALKANRTQGAENLHWALL